MVDRVDAPDVGEYARGICRLSFSANRFGSERVDGIRSVPLICTTESTVTGTQLAEYATIESVSLQGLGVTEIESCSITSSASFGLPPSSVPSPPSIVFHTPPRPSKAYTISPLHPVTTKR